MDNSLHNLIVCGPSLHLTKNTFEPTQAKENDQGEWKNNSGRNLRQA